MIKVIIADDHEIVRSGLRLTFESESDVQLIGEARNGNEVLQLTAELKPDIVLMDIKMPEKDGIEAARIIHEKYPDVKVIILSSFYQDEQIYEAIKAGADGYLLKDVGGEELLEAIRKCVKGEPQLHPEITKRMMQQIPEPDSPFKELTQREQEILKLLAFGMSNKDICVKLSLSEPTVKGYVSSLLSKLGVEDRTQAALLAVRYKFVNLDDLPEI